MRAALSVMAGAWQCPETLWVCVAGEGWLEGGGGKAALLQGQAGDGAEKGCEGQLMFLQEEAL